MPLALCRSVLLVHSTDRVFIGTFLLSLKTLGIFIRGRVRWEPVAGSFIPEQVVTNLYAEPPDLRKEILSTPVLWAHEKCVITVTAWNDNSHNKMGCKVQKNFK